VLLLLLDFIFSSTLLYLWLGNRLLDKKIKRETLAKLSSCPGSEHASENNNTFNIILNIQLIAQCFIIKIH